MTIVNTAPTLEDLPSPPPDKTGWPWTEQAEPLPECMPDGSEWPCISIVTPSYNQEQFIEETIRSVLLQGYPNLEYVVIDGGSADNSLQIIRKYEKHISYWVSESDQGQSDALNKGFRNCKGEIVGFLNSDDVYLSGALAFAAQFLTQNPQYSFVCGQTSFIDSKSQKIKGFEELFMVELNSQTMTEACHIAQPSTFFRVEVFQQSGYFNAKLQYCFDYEFWLRNFLAGLEFKSVSQVLSKFRIHSSSKTNNAYNEGQFDLDFISIYKSALLDKKNKSYKQGLRNGLGMAASLLFVHTEATKSTIAARKALLEVIYQTPEVLLSISIWPTFLVSLSPSIARKTWKAAKNNISSLRYRK